MGWLSLPAETRQQAWRLALTDHGHPDPAVQAVAVKWHRVWRRAAIVPSLPVASIWVLAFLTEKQHPVVEWLGNWIVVPWIYAAAWVTLALWTRRLATLAAPNLWALASRRDDAASTLTLRAGLTFSALVPLALILLVLAISYDTIVDFSRPLWQIAIIFGAPMMVVFIPTWMVYHFAAGPTRRLPGSVVAHLDEKGLTVPAWRLHVPWHHVSGLGMSRRSWPGTILGLGVGLNDPAMVWTTSDLNARRQHNQQAAAWIFIPSWAWREPIEDVLATAIRHHTLAADVVADRADSTSPEADPRLGG